MKEKNFYDDGLQFECQRCSQCCRFDPGYVFLSENDLKLLSEKLNLTETETIQRYCRKVDIGGFTRLSLVEKKNYDCIFWEEGGCVVYDARPVQCRTFPFWINYLEDESDWRNLSKECPGIGKGKIVSKEEIEAKILDRQNDKALL